MSDQASLTTCVIVAAITLILMMVCVYWWGYWEMRWPSIPPIGPIMVGAVAFLFFAMAIWGVGQRI